MGHQFTSPPSCALSKRWPKLLALATLLAELGEPAEPNAEPPDLLLDLLVDLLLSVPWKALPTAMMAWPVPAKAFPVNEANVLTALLAPCFKALPILCTEVALFA